MKAEPGKVANRLAQITALHEGYFNTDQGVEVFAREFFFSVGEILEGKDLKDLRLKFLDLGDISIPKTEANSIAAKSKRKGIPELLKKQWTEIDKNDTIMHRILVDKQEFYAVEGMGNLLFTPEEVNKARLRFSMYPKTEREWHIWDLSEDDIKELARQTQIDIEGLDLDTIVHFFKKGFLPLVDSWENVLAKAIEQTRADQLTHDKPGGQ
jgi:hypothetical protein